VSFRTRKMRTDTEQLIWKDREMQGTHTAPCAKMLTLPGIFSAAPHTGKEKWIQSTLVNRDFLKRDFALNGTFSVRFGFAPKFASFSGIYQSVIGIFQNFGQRSKKKVESVKIDDLGVLLVILLQTEAPMGKELSVQQKRKLWEYRSELENDGRKLSYKDACTNVAVN
jgi:hypothetical protein